jgi:hypothetical protein
MQPRVSASEIRKEKADAHRSMIMTLAEQVLAVLRESGASEEESYAALECAKLILPFQHMESSKGGRHTGG